MTRLKSIIEGNAKAIVLLLVVTLFGLMLMNANAQMQEIQNQEQKINSLHKELNETKAKLNEVKHFEKLLKELARSK